MYSVSKENGRRKEDSTVNKISSCVFLSWGQRKPQKSKTKLPSLLDLALVLPDLLGANLEEVETSSRKLSLGVRIVLGRLPVERKSKTVTHTTVRTHIDHVLKVVTDFFLQSVLNQKLSAVLGLFNLNAELGSKLRWKHFHFCEWVNSHAATQAGSKLGTDTVNLCESKLDHLVVVKGIAQDTELCRHGGELLFKRNTRASKEKKTNQQVSKGSIMATDSNVSFLLWYPLERHSF